MSREQMEAFILAHVEFRDRLQSRANMALLTENELRQIVLIVQSVRS